MINERIKALKKQRAEVLEKSTTLSKLAETENRMFTEEEGKTFAGFLDEVRNIDKNIDALLEQERLLTLNIDPGTVRPPLVTGGNKAFKAFPGQALTRFIATLAKAKGNIMQAAELSKRWDDTTPEVGEIIRAAVAVGTTADATWAGPLVNYQVMVSEFIDFLRPQTILGKLTGYRPVPFNIKIQRQTAGYSAQWVGEGMNKPVGSIAFDQITLPWAKIALISVITEELARMSNPAAETLVRNDLASAVAQFMDLQFMDPTVTPVAAVKPGSITNGAHVIPASGNSVAHVTADLTAATLWLTDQNLPMAAPVWIMHNHAYQFLITQRSSIDTFIWKDEMLGGKLLGIPFIVSNNVPLSAGLSSITLFDAGELLLADDGQMMFDASAEASLQMDSAPVTPNVAATVLVSLWQQNLLGIKVERYIYWLMRRGNASEVVQITGFPAATP